MIRRTTLLPAVLLAAAFLLPLAASAQYPRKILIEEATNASCGPCAAQNPFFEYYLSLPHNEEDIIPIIYHSKFPGSDVMNASNPTMHNGRVTYYGINGVPSALVNGRISVASGGSYDGAPSDTIALARAVNKVRGTMSPITIRLGQIRNGNDITGAVVVYSAEAIENQVLHIVAVERHHYYTAAGGNGEKDFYYIARKMFPSESGTPLTLAAGETKNFTADYTLDASWNPEEMYFVAFVQDAATKEVMQVGTNRGNIGFSSSTSLAVMQQNDEPVSWSGDLSTTITGSYTVTIANKTPAGWNVDVRANGESVQTGGTIALQEESATPLRVVITPSSSASKSGKGSVTVTVTGAQGTEFSRTFTVYAKDLTAIVIQKDEGRTDIAPAFETALAGGDVKYAVVERSDEALFDITQYPVVIYEVGKAALTREGIEQLRSYFDKGGRMLLTGAEIGYGLMDPQNTDTVGSPRDASFFNEYLHADYVKDANLSAPIKGLAGDPIGDGLSFSIQNGVKNQDTPDEITPRDGAQPIFYFGSTQSVAGIRYEDAKNRLVYLGFGIEGIGNLQQRAEVLRRSIAWLLSAPASAPVEVASATALNAIRPNPASGSFAVPFQLGRAGHVSIALYDVRGQRVASLADAAFEAGPHTVHADAAMLPAGAYTVVMNAGGAVSTRMVTIVR